MEKRLTNEEASKILSDCMPEKCFWVHDGPIVKNLQDLSSAMKYLSDEQFTHHITKEKNDFSKWVGEVVGDEELAKTLARVRSKTSATKKINERLEALKQAATAS